MRKVSQIAPIAGEILFIFSLKMKRLDRKAGIAFAENAVRFASEKKASRIKSILKRLFRKLIFCNFE